MDIPDGYGQATLTWTITGGVKQYSVVISIGDGSWTSGDDADAIADNVYSALVQTGCPCHASEMVTGWTFQGVTTLMGGTGTTQSNGSQGPAVNGTATAGSPPQELVPAYSPMVITKRTSAAGRRGRGRMYVPMIKGVIGDVDYNGVIEGSELGAIQTLWTNWLAVMQLTPASQLNVAHTGGIATPNVVTSLLVRPVVGSQRRRKVRGA